MERHAAIPQFEDFERMRGEMPEVVEQHVADAAAEDDSERDPDDEIVEIDDRERGLPAPKTLRGNDRTRVEPAGDDADDIGEGIPAYGQRSDRKHHRIDRRK